MTLFLDFISKEINAIILVVGIIITVFLLWNGAKLSEKKSLIEEAVSRSNKKWGINPVDGAVVAEEDEDASVTPDTIRKYESDFNKKCAIHSVLAQLIPVFPLLGMLGTVAGLMSLISNQGVEKMLSSMDTALSSTLFGLIFSIILKAIDAIYPARVIEEVDNMLDDYSKKLDLADMIQKIKEVN